MKKEKGKKLLFGDEITAEENDPPEVVETDETDIVHLAPGHHFAFLGVDSLEEAVEALHAALRHQPRVQLQNLRLEELAVHVRVQVGLLPHQLREPFETSLAVGHEDGSLYQTVPDLTCLRGAQPQLTIFQQEAKKTQPLLDLSTWKNGTVTIIIRLTDMISN